MAVHTSVYTSNKADSNTMANEKDIKNLAHATEDIPEELELAKEWWATHGNIVTGVLAVMLAVVLGARWWHGRTEARENAAMTELQQAASPDALERLIDQNASRNATALARLRLGAVQYAAGKYDLAKAAYSDFVSSEPKHPLIDTATYGLAQCEEALGNVAESTALFRQFGTKFPDSPLAPLAELGVARGLILEGSAESRREGKALLDLFLTEHAGEQWAISADELIRAHNRLSIPEKPAEASDISSFLSAGAPEAEAETATDADVPATAQESTPEPSPEPSQEPSPGEEATPEN